MTLPVQILWLIPLGIGVLASASAADVRNGGFEDRSNRDWLGCPLGDCMTCSPTSCNGATIQVEPNAYLQLQATPHQSVRAMQDEIFVDVCVRNSGYATLEFKARLGSDCGAASVTLSVGGLPVTKDIPFTSTWTTYKLSLDLDCPTDEAEIWFGVCGDDDVNDPGTELHVDDVTLCWTPDDQSSGLMDFAGCGPICDACEPTTTNFVPNCGSPRGTNPACELCCPWDLNDDGDVGPADLAILLDAWGANPGSPADFNCDDVVDAADLAELLDHWGACP